MASVMDRTARFGERFDRLTDVYKCFLTGSCPTQSVADVANVIYSGVCGLVLGYNNCVSSEYTIALTCNCLTLVEKVTSNLTSHSQLLDVNSYYMELLGMLFFNMDLMSQLVNQFQTEDQIISHLAAKSASTGVFFHIHKSGMVSPVWLRTCVQAFYSSTPGIELDACLWSLTDVIKRLLRGAFQGILKKLVAAVDSSLCALCSKFLTKKPTVTQSLDFTKDRQWTTTFCLLLDLLEVLTASSLIPGSGVCLKSQRLTHIHLSALLATISYTTRYFVKKRVLLLLKRTVLETVGEDWALRENVSTGPKFKCFSFDMSMLAETVLAAVAANWLHSVQVKPASFFGGTRHIRYDGQKPDCVMLRAASLLLLKSMELQIQTAGGTAGVDGALKLNGYLQRLWCFLRQCIVWLPETIHLCCLVSLVFEEQDDDMMEATKALLSIFLHHRQLSGLDISHVFEEACASGCNPHCHFLILLQRVFFDHSILLDFLISTETCFLEYFVRYLKFLTVNWQGFAMACQRIRMSDSHLSLLTSLTNSRDSVVYAQAYKGQPLVKNTSLATGRRLVEYESSDDSDQEYMKISQDKPETSVCEKSKLNALHLTKSTIGPHIKQPKSLTLQNMSEQQTCKNIAYLTKVTCETSLKTVICLSKLREVVMRLQTKKLFPYNPSSLLKLLERVQKCSQQSQL